jgi:hypothetical protein
VEHFVDARSCNLYWGTRLKCQKPVVKVVRDILTKKCVFMKRNKQLRAMSHSSHHKPLSNNKAMIEQPVENQSSYRQRNVSTKSKKTCFTVAQNWLMKKWVIGYKDQQLRDVFEMATLLEALRIPS